MSFEDKLDKKFCYNATVTGVYDGDTITCEIDLGFSVKTLQKVRLFGIDTPELRKEEYKDGIIARDKLRELILDKNISLYTIKDKKGKYGRYLGIIYKDNVNINRYMIDNGYAVEYMLK
jgi:micrococcal nuclease